MRAWNDLEGVELPEWARFVATDLGGFRYCYPERPVAGDRIWHRGGDPLKHIDTVNLGGSDWRDTLIDLEEYRAARQEQTRAKIMAEFKVEPAPDATTAPSILQAAIQHMDGQGGHGSACLANQRSSAMSEKACGTSTPETIGELQSLCAASAPGTKHDAGKVQPTLVLDGFARALHAVSEVATHGAEKYGPGNWQLVEDGIKRYSDARDRHRLARAMGEERDPESGLLHAAHEAWNALAVLELMLRDCS